MLLVIIGSLGVLAFLAVFLGFVPPPHASTLIRIRDGTVQVDRGRVPARAREYIADILREAGVSSGYSAITSNNWVTFSRRIPPQLHQRLRNFILNL